MPCTKLERTENGCRHFWPKNSIAASVLLVVSTYTTLIAIVDQASTKEALKDADNQTVFNINEEIRNVTVSVISKSILWNCREYSMTRSYYKNIYILLITALFVYIFIGMFKIPRYYRRLIDNRSCENDERKCEYIIQAASDWLIRISLVFMLTSYDVSPWLCFCGPSSIIYTKDTQDVDLEIPNSIINYQKAAPIISLILGMTGWLIGMAILEDEEIRKETDDEANNNSNNNNNS